MVEVNLLAPLKDFNPHLRMGGDKRVVIGRAHAWTISIHTSVWEVTFELTPITKSTRYFNPHLRMGGDQKGDCKAIPFSNFNPHLRMGGDIH